MLAAGQGRRISGGGSRVIATANKEGHSVLDVIKPGAPKNQVVAYTTYTPAKGLLFMP